MGFPDFRRYKIFPKIVFLQIPLVEVVLISKFSCCQVDRASAGTSGAGDGGGESDDVHSPHLLQCGGLGLSPKTSEETETELLTFSNKASP